MRFRRRLKRTNYYIGEVSSSLVYAIGQIEIVFVLQHFYVLAIHNSFRTSDCRLVDVYTVIAEPFCPPLDQLRLTRFVITKGVLALCVVVGVAALLALFYDVAWHELQPSAFE